MCQGLGPKRHNEISEIDRICTGPGGRRLVGPRGGSRVNNDNNNNNSHNNNVNNINNNDHNTTNNTNNRVNNDNHNNINNIMGTTQTHPTPTNQIRIDFTNLNCSEQAQLCVCVC